MSSEQQSTAPSNLSANARGYKREENAQRIGSNVLGLVQIFGKHINLETLDSITLAQDCGNALAELDRGVDVGTTLQASQDWAIGVAMTPSVLRDGQVKSHIGLMQHSQKGLMKPLNTCFVRKQFICWRTNALMWKSMQFLNGSFPTE